MKKSRNQFPVAFDFLFYERAINVQARVPFNAGQAASSVLVDDDWLRDASVGQYGILEFCGCRCAVFVVATSHIERESNPVVVDLARVILFKKRRIRGFVRSSSISEMGRNVNLPALT